jgi:hypothetical protein
MGRKSRTTWAAGERPKPEDTWRKLYVNNELVPVKPVLYTKMKGTGGTGHRQYIAGEINSKLIVDPITQIPLPYKAIGSKKWILQNN